MKVEGKKLFSVVTIVYNDVKNISRTIESVINQNFDGVEYIVVDGASTDGTSDKIKPYLSRISSYVCEKDSGIYNAMNKGLELVKGDYVLFMNSGDVFSDHFVLERISELIGDSRPALVYGDYQESLDGKTISKRQCRESDKIWWGPVASHQSTFYNVSFLRRYGLKYDETYRIAADYNLTLKVITLSNGNVLKTNICVSDFDISGASNVNQDRGLAEANRARHEVLKWGKIRCSALKVLLLTARYTKRFARPVYNLLRR